MPMQRVRVRMPEQIVHVVQCMVDADGVPRYLIEDAMYVREDGYPIPVS